MDREPTLHDSGSGRSRPTGPAALVGRRLAQYRVQRLIAEGGMGAVYEAFHEGLQRSVALKTLMPRGESGEDVQRFATEARVLARLDHPNVVPVLDVGEAGGIRYIAMELVRGDSLYELIRTQGTLEEDTALELVRQAAAGLQHAHELGVLHRDLKPANVLLQDGVARLTDFGVAKVAGNARLTATGTALGTPNYMAPEQAMGRNEQLDARCDVYGLGAILYECLTGVPPFNAASAVETMNAVVREAVVPPRARNPKVSKAAEAICLRCLSKRPDDRYGSAEEVAEEIGRLEDGQALAGDAGPWSSRLVGPLAVVGGMSVVALVSLAILAAVRPPGGGSIHGEVRRYRSQVLKEVEGALGGEPASLRAEAERLGWGAFREAAQRRFAGDEGARAGEVDAALGGRAAHEAQVGALRAKALWRLADAAGDAGLADAVEVARLDPQGEHGARAGLRVARALLATGDPAARALAEEDLAGLAARGDGVGPSARVALAGVRAEGFAWSEAAALLAGLEPSGDDGARAASLRRVCEGFAPGWTLPEHDAALAARDGEGPLLVLAQGNAVNVYRLAPDADRLGPPVRQIVLGQRALRRIAVADWNRDGTSDVLLVAEEGGYTYLQVVPVSGAGQAKDVALPIPGLKVSDVAAGDVDGDGYGDFAVAYWQQGERSVVLRGGPEGRPGPLFASATEAPGLARAFSSVALVDLDGDGKDEVCLGSSGAGSHALDVRTLGAGFGSSSRGTVPTGPVKDLIPFDVDGGRQRLLVVVDLGPDDPTVEGDLPWLGRDGLLVVGAEDDGVPAVLGRWSVEGGRGECRNLVAWAQDLGGEPWIGRAYEGRAGWTVELLPASRLVGEASPPPVWSATRPEAAGRLAALPADLDGDGDQELVLGRRLWGLGPRPRTTPSEPWAPAGLEGGLLAAARRLSALGLTSAAAAAVAELRELDPGGAARHALGSGDDLLRRADGARRRGELMLRSGARAEGEELLRKAEAGLALAAERCEQLSRSPQAGPREREEACARAAFAHARAGDFERAAAVGLRALASPGLSPLVEERVAGDVARWEQLRDLGAVEIDFANEVGGSRLGILRPLRASVGGGGLRLRCEGGVQDAALVPLVAEGLLPLRLQAELSLDGGAWGAQAQIGVFLASAGGSFTGFAGFELDLSGPVAHELRLGARLGDQALLSPVAVPLRGDLVLGLTLAPAPGGGVQGLLRVSGGDGRLLQQVRFSQRDLGAPAFSSGFAGLNAPLSSAPAQTCVEDADWPMATWITLRRLEVRARQPRLSPMNGVWPGHSALVGGKLDAAMRVYGSVRQGSQAPDALWGRAFARHRGGDGGALQDLLDLARQKPYFFFLRLEDLGAGSFAGDPRDRQLLAQTLAALSKGDALLSAMAQSLRGEHEAVAALDPNALPAGGRRATAAYLRMRDLSDPQGRWRWRPVYRQFMGAQARLPRTLFPPLLDLREGALDEEAYAALLRPVKDLRAHVGQLERALAERPQAALPRLHLARRYNALGMFGLAEAALREAARMGPTLEERGSVQVELARALAGMGALRDALSAARAAKDAGAPAARLEELRAALGREPGFHELLR